jgi:DNA-binding Xre family transcriptional regulator
MLVLILFRAYFYIESVPKQCYTEVVPTIAGGLFMSKRWSINEDLIICQYCIDYPGAYNDMGHTERISHLLHEAGYEARSIRSIQHRAYAVEIVRENRQLPYASEQVAEVYRALTDESVSKHQEITACIRELYNPDEESGVESLNLNPNNTIGFQHKIAYSKTFPMVLQKYVNLRNIKHKDLCERIGMSIHTFSAILRGKYPTVKKESIFQICIGLGLCTMQVEDLLNSAGYALSNAIMTDVVIRACIQNRQYNPIAINRELKENGAPPLFPDCKIPLRVYY